KTSWKLFQSVISDDGIETTGTGAAGAGLSRSNLGKANQRDDLVRRDLAVVELPEEDRELLRAPHLRVVVLDVPRRELTERRRLDLVDDRVEHLLARPVARADEHLHDHPFLVLPGLVPQADRRRLAARTQLVGHDRRIEVEGVHQRRRPTAPEAR